MEQARAVRSADLKRARRTALVSSAIVEVAIEEIALIWQGLELLCGQKRANFADVGRREGEREKERERLLDEIYIDFDALL